MVLADLEMLREKTSGNLGTDESNSLNKAIEDLGMKVNIESER